jgi:hypothetical protein
MNRADFDKAFISAVQLADADHSGVADKLYPLFHGVDLRGKTLFIYVDPGSLSVEQLYMYGQRLKELGASGSVFLGKGVDVAILSDQDLQQMGLRRV